MELRRKRFPRQARKHTNLSWLVTFIMVFTVAATFFSLGLERTIFNIDFAQQELKESGLRAEISKNLATAIAAERPDFLSSDVNLLTEPQINKDVDLALENFYADKQTIFDANLIANQVGTNLDKYVASQSIISSNSEEYLSLKSALVTNIQENLTSQLTEVTDLGEIQADFIKVKQVVKTVFTVGLVASLILGVILVLLQGLRPFAWCYYWGLAGCWALIPSYLLLLLADKYQVFIGTMSASDKLLATGLSEILGDVLNSMQISALISMIVAISILVLGLIGMRLSGK